MAETFKSIYDFLNYREFLRYWIDHYPDGSWGLLGKMAEALGVSPSMISLVLKGDKTLTPEQSMAMCEFMLLNEKETDYFFLLVDFDRAGLHTLKKRIEKKIKESRQAANQLKNRIKTDKELSDEAKAQYYSHWYYTGIRNLIAIDGVNTIQQIAQRTQLPPHLVSKVVEFMLENNLCKKEKDKLTYNFAHTHLDANSPFVSRHHQNWRQYAFSKMDANLHEDLFFTSPMSLSVEAAKEIRRLLPNLIENVKKIAGPSDSETTYCLNIDWFEF